MKLPYLKQMENPFNLLSLNYLDLYRKEVGQELLEDSSKLVSKSSFSSTDFEYYFVASSLYSSKIEGNTLDANSFFRNRGNRDFPKKKEIQEIEELVKAYQYASDNPLTLKHFLKTHQILAQSLLSSKWRGKPRQQAVGVHDSETLRPVYLAVEPEYVEAELNKLFADIQELLNSELSQIDVFYFASMIHLWTALIHPFMDGNGRSARLIEKWFLASKLGPSVWSIRSEQHYWEHRPDYYKNIALGFNYYALYWERCQPFLRMLPQALRRSIP